MPTVVGYSLGLQYPTVLSCVPFCFAALRCSVVQFVGVLLRPVPSVVTRFMENGSVENLLVSTDRPAAKDLVARMAVEATKGVIHLHRCVNGCNVCVPIGMVDSRCRAYSFVI